MTITIAFDCDDTLLKWNEDGTAVPNHNVIDLLRWFERNGHEVIVWSGGGVDYAARWAVRFGLRHVRIVEKGSVPVDIAVDDFGAGDDSVEALVNQELRNAKVTIRV